MDEIFTWKEVTDPSLWHLYWAIQHGADGGQPLFYTTAWLWAKVFGGGVLTLRLYSSVAVCAALVVVWITLRRCYGLWSTAFGLLFFWGTSNTLLDQNVEARFYGLYLLTVAITIYLYLRLLDREEPSRFLLWLAFLSQAALVLTHVLGLVYSGLMLFVLLLVDFAKRRLRFKVYVAYIAGWFALLLWLPAIRASMAAGKPHGWIVMPTFTDLRTAYLFADSLQWLRLFKRHSMEAGFQIVARTAELVIYGSIFAVLLYAVLRIRKSGWRMIAEPRRALLLLSCLLLAAPVMFFGLSHVVTPVFVNRYFLPSGIGLAIVLTACADKLGADKQGGRHWLWVAVVLMLMASPVITILAIGPPELSWAYLDIPRVERNLEPGTPLVAGWQEDFVKFMRLSSHPNGQYYFLLDWPGALSGPRGFVLDYHLMKAYRDSGYYSEYIVDNRNFLCAHPDFMVLDSPIADTADAQRPKWFESNVKSHPEFSWKVIDSLNEAEVSRKLILVHRIAPLQFCSSSN